MSCTKIVVNTSCGIMGLSFITVHNDAVVVDAVFDKNTSHVQGPWIMTTTNFALSMGWAARFGSFLARCTHFPRNIGMFALIWSCVRILPKVLGLMLIHLRLGQYFGSRAFLWPSRRFLTQPSQSPLLDGGFELWADMADGIPN